MRSFADVKEINRWGRGKGEDKWDVKIIKVFYAQVPRPWGEFYYMPEACTNKNKN